MRSEACPVCASEEHVELRKSEIDNPDKVLFTYTFSPDHGRTFRIVRCARCAHTFASPVPADIARNYVDTVDREYLLHGRSRRLAAVACLNVIQKYAPGGRLLDVGCATGDFLACAATAGYAAEGLEISRWAAQAAREQGATVHEEFLDSFASKRENQYDVVTLWGVIEHFANPAREVTHIGRLVKPGGIVALWTGGIDSVTSRVFGRKWWHWQGQHIQYFSHDSLRRLFEAKGFKHIRTYHYPFAMTYETLSNSLRRYPLMRPLLLALMWPLFALFPVLYWRIPGEMFFLARREK